MIHQYIQKVLLAEQDMPYAAFSAKLIPTVDPTRIIGVRVPALRAMAKELNKRDDICAFMSVLPHTFFEEDQLHALLLSLPQDFEALIKALDAFLPFVDNWSTCDILSPKVKPADFTEFLEHIKRWMGSKHEYTVRFGVGMLMQYFLDEAFEPRFVRWVADLRSDAYYVNMMIAWYFATALAKQYEAVLPFIEQKQLAPWTHNKAIQKAIESSRITAEQKSTLRELKIKS